MKNIIDKFSKQPKATKISLIAILVAAMLLLGVFVVELFNKPVSKNDYMRVVYDYNYDNITKAYKVEYGATIEDLKIERDKYVLMGWYLDGKLFDFSQPIIKDMTIVAKWKKLAVDEVIVTFDSDGGSTVENQIIKKGETVKEPAFPTREGFSFEGWYDGEVKFDFTSKVEKSITLVAKWQEKAVAGSSKSNNNNNSNNNQSSPEQSTPQTFTITYDSNGGSPVDPQVYKKDEQLRLAAPPTKDGYSFKYWADVEGNYAPAFEDYYYVFANKTFQAQWAKNQNVDYYLETGGDGSCMVDINYKTNSTTIITTYVSESIAGPYSPYGGWYSPRSYEGGFDGHMAIVSVPKGETRYFKYNIQVEALNIDIMTNAVKITGFVPTPKISVETRNNTKYIKEELRQYAFPYGVEIYVSDTENGSYSFYRRVLYSDYEKECINGWYSDSSKSTICAYTNNYFIPNEMGKYYKLRIYYQWSDGESVYSDFSNPVYY